MNMTSQFNRFIYLQYHLLKLYLYWRFSSSSEKVKSQKIRHSFEKLGPLFIKLGQLLSTRSDLVSVNMAQELSLLQDKVTPFCGKWAQKIIEHTLQKPMHEIFVHFDSHPLASASISQVHAATLAIPLQNQDKGNDLLLKQVVVKVLRPHIHRIIQTDLGILSKLVFVLTVFWPRTKKLKPKDLLLELKNVLTQELDLTREGSSAQQLKRNFQNTKQLYVPEIHWNLSKNNILIMERIDGLSLNNTNKLVDAGFNLKLIAESLIDLFFCQVFRDGYFHADMHPGNIFVDPTSSPAYIKAHSSVSLLKNQVPSFIAVDFGIMGSLSPMDQLYLAENFKAIFNRDYRAIAELHKASGWLSAHVRIDEFEAAMRYVLDPLLEQPLESISFGQLLVKLLQTAMDYHIIIQPQLLLLQKTLLNVEGVARSLDPQLNIWETGKTCLEKHRRNAFKMKPLLKTIKMTAPYWVDKLHQLPMLLQTFLMPSHSANQADFKLNTAATADQSISRKDLYIGILLGITMSLVAFLFLRD